MNILCRGRDLYGFQDIYDVNWGGGGGGMPGLAMRDFLVSDIECFLS